LNVVNPWEQITTLKSLILCYNGIMGDKLSTWLVGELNKRGWPFRELARRTGISAQSIMRYANGERTPVPESCRKIADALGVPYQKVMMLAGHLPLNNGDLDITEAQVEILNAARKIEGKEELSIYDLTGREEDPMLEDFKLIWDILPYNERQKLIHMAEDLKREQKGKSAEEGAAGKMTIGRTVEGTV
jgi:transcriptional regulator with XRE-family HTH domain